jgi:hypothetical protein
VWSASGLRFFRIESPRISMRGAFFERRCFLENSLYTPRLFFFNRPVRGVLTSNFSRPHRRLYAEIGRILLKQALQTPAFVLRKGFVTPNPTTD